MQLKKPSDLNLEIYFATDVTNVKNAQLNIGKNRQKCPVYSLVLHKEIVNLLEWLNDLSLHKN
ncbi:hypothetical protein NPA13_00615 [Mycoplasma sp. 2045]|uniref:hypothetical protein n=1 Tax=Mycoplasma sp. 2045 TaxID=2967301 RepID=UPI00211C7910|nr:hypothetical protein [Mycoplasma sp. 2045]UUM20511.1 hypothetical protein NPA13_00615 [Mycoplasma sp. 2045]